MRTATIFASYEQVQRYLKISADVTGHPLDPAVALEPIDAFVLKQLVDCYPGKLAIIDMAGEASLGTSTVFWATQEQIGKLLVVTDDVLLNPAGDSWNRPSWKDLVRDVLSEDERSGARITFLTHGMNALESEADLRKHVSSTQQLVIMIAVNPNESDQLIEQLTRLLHKHNNAIIALTGLGRVGVCRNVDSALAVCHSESRFQFSVVREISPFMASSKLGLIYPKTNGHMSEILHRIERFYKGNFDFLGTIEANVELKIKMQACLEQSEQLRSELVVAHEDLVRVRRALTRRTEELEAAYAVTGNGKPDAVNVSSIDERSPRGQALADIGAVMAWMKRGSR
jgi:hypothetical protein